MSDPMVLSAARPRLAAPALALLGYLSFYASILYFLAFLVRGPAAPPGATAIALAIDLGLVLAFGLQHSVMARPAFKRLWTRPGGIALERTVFVLASSAALVVLCLAWRPLPGVVWDLGGPLRVVVWAAYAGGALFLVAAAWQIDALALAGVRQALEHAGWMTPRPDPGLVVRGLYRYMRHPIATGWLLVLWLTPTMTTGRLLLAVALSAYVFIGTALEERGLVARFGETYRAYRATTPAYWPRLRRAGGR
jgi:protein-S-isoprenylcysteine O-methyltransferase Ste14